LSSRTDIRGAIARIRSRTARRSLAAHKPDAIDVGTLFRWCLERGLDTRAQYLWGVLVAARTALGLGIPSITAIEFGVAGGNGLLALERAAATATELTGVEIESFGFDTGAGMPPPVDHRDVPWVIQEGWFEMDERLLRSRLTSAELVLGPVAATVPAWIESGHPPLGFAAFDLDYYSATVDALGVLEASAERLLPRVACYFDDLFGYGWSDFTGERAAIADFNSSHGRRKIGKVHGLRYELPPAQHPLAWHEQMYMAHLFDHPEYCTHEGVAAGAVADAWFAAHRLPPEA
jgi:hypothetical protein